MADGLRDTIARHGPDAVAFYVSDVYAPLMQMRHATTDPRLLVMARAGALPAEERADAERYLRARAASSRTAGQSVAE